MIKAIKKILVIDDDPVFVRFIERRLEGDGYSVREAYNGQTGIQLAKDDIPDLIVLDVLMPDIDGQNVVRILRAEKSTQNIPVIFTTVTIELEDDKGNETINVDGEVFRAFAKPIHVSKVLSVIRKSINKHIHGNN